MKASGLASLPDVVVVGGDAHQQRVGADGLGGAFGEVAHHERVVVRAGGLEEQPAQQRLRRVGQLEQLERGGEAEEVAQHGERADGHDGRSDGRREGRTHELGRAGQVVVAEQAEDAHHGHADHADQHRRLRELLQPLTAADRHDARQSAEDDVDAQLDASPRRRRRARR